MDKTKKRLLFVCLGNICRSPAAEAVMRKMVADAGLGVAMGNATAAVKAAAKAVTADCDHDGVAEIIERYLL